MSIHKNEVGQAGTGINGGEFARKTQTDAPANVITIGAESQILREFLDEYDLAKTPDHERAILDQWIAWTDDPDEDAPWVVQERNPEDLRDVHAMLLRFRLGDPAAEARPDAGDAISAYIAGEDYVGIDDEEVVVLSHAEGDFDATTVGFESIELYREETGNIYITAVTDLDLHHLNPDTDWLNANTEKISQAFSALYLNATMHVSDLVDNTEFRFDVGSGQIREITADGAVGFVNADETASRFITDVESGAFWEKLRDELGN